ncbi:MAG: ABC transporter ATP-binding protein [Fimbriimonas sp.]|nr:ABC transporter ATP-binding protein [Fimbriimonas sp.]
MRRYSRTPMTDEDKLVKLSFTGITRLLKLAAPYKARLLVAGLLTLLTSAITLSLPLITKQGIDVVVNTHSLDSLDSMVVKIVGLVLLSSVFGYSQYMIAAYAGNRIVMDLRCKLFAHLQRLPVAYFDRNRSGDLTSHLSNDVGMLQSTLTDDIVKLGGNIVVLVGMMAVALYVDWVLTVVVMSVLTVTMAGFVVSGIALRKLTRKGLDALADVMGMMSEAIANIRLVKAFAREPYEDKRSNEKLITVFGISMRSAVWEGMMGTVAAAGMTLVILGVFWYGGKSVLEGRITVGKLIAFVMTILFISGPMASLASLWTRLQRAVGAADRLFAILDEHPEEADPEGAIDFRKGPGEVLLKDIEFAYVADTPVLRKLTLELLPGKVTAIVGPSGSGKTTVSSLLYRFYEAQSGVITIDGVPIRSIKRSSLRQHIGIVPQDTILFNGTIRENIRYGRLDATDAEVEAAAKAANIEEFVSGFKEGYETMIGERGITLSGGQRQRVAIARVMLKDPEILILDEATSALDTISESLVREALDRLMQGRTTMVIAHRLSTVQSADQIAVLAEGKVVEIGTHTQLLEHGGRYAELYELVGA